MINKKKTPTQVEAYFCDECRSFCMKDEIYEDDALYECSSCGNTFNRHSTGSGDNRCPECNKFGARQEGDVCPHCGEGVVRAMIAWACPKCGKPHEDDEDAMKCCRTKKPVERIILKGEVSWDGVPESELFEFEHPVDLLRDPSRPLPKHVRHQGLVYTLGGGVLCAASCLFHEGKTLQTIYTVCKFAFVTHNGKSVNLEHTDHPNLTCPHERQAFTLYWSPQGLILSPAGAVWGERLSVHDELPDDLVSVSETTKKVARGG